MKEAGKGDRYRPVDQKKWDEGYERAFGSRDPCKDCDMDFCLTMNCQAKRDYDKEKYLPTANIIKETSHG